MKNSSWKMALEAYKANDYSDELIRRIEWLQENSIEEDPLEKYQYIQPDGELYSERSLEIILALENIQSLLESQREISDEIEESLKKLIQLKFQKEEEKEDVFPGGHF